MLAALIVVAIVVVLLVLVLSAAIKILREYERGVIFRLGRLLGTPKGPGLIFLIPIVDKMVRVDLRTITLMIPPQEVITKDNVPVRVNAVCYFRVVDAVRLGRPGRELHGRDLADRADDAAVGARPARRSTSCCPSARRSTRSSRGSSTRAPLPGASRSRSSR